MHSSDTWETVFLRECEAPGVSPTCDQRGEFSGCFTFSKVRFNPNQECTILDFGPQGFQRAHIHLRETAQQLPPDIRSDQFVAGRIMIEALYVSSPELQFLNESGNRRPSVWLSLRCKLLGNPGCSRPNLNQSAVAAVDIEDISKRIHFQAGWPGA